MYYCIIPVAASRIIQSAHNRLKGNHYISIYSLLEKNASLNKELEELKKKYSNENTEINTYRIFSNISTQTPPLVAKERAAAIHNEGVGWLQDEVRFFNPKYNYLCWLRGVLRASYRMDNYYRFNYWF